MDKKYHSFIERHLPLHHDDPKIFVRIQWQLTSYTPIWYILLKFSIAIFFFASWTTSIIDPSHLDKPQSYRNKQWIYISHWGYTVCVVQAFVSVIMVTCSYFEERNNGLANTSKVIKFLYKPYWILNVVATDVGLLITFIFWGLQIPFSSERIAPLMFMVHACNSIIMLFDLCIAAYPVRILHFYFSVIFLLIYVGFTLIYYLLGGTSKAGDRFIYHLIDWENPGISILICFGMLIFVFVLHLCVYGIYKLRLYLSKRIMGIKENTDLYNT